MQNYILLIEDDPDIRQVLEYVLKEENFNVSSVRQGQEALNFLATHPYLPNLILLDMMMPVMDGQSFRQHQLKDSRLASIPTVMLSADSHLPQKAEQLGIKEYLRKPIKLTDLFELVERYIRS